MDTEVTPASKTAELAAKIAKAVDEEVTGHNDAMGIYNGPDGKPLPKETLDAVQIAAIVKRHCEHVDAEAFDAFCADVTGAMQVEAHKYEPVKA